ncbi:MAG TPA: DUF6054 family protein [Caproicibacter sp.]|nr:DUF6054 family protein [Caproicibacter sp.]
MTDSENTFFVTLNPREAFDKIDQTVVGGSITGECIDSYEISAPNGGSCIVAVYEKHYYRAGNRLTLTVVMDDFRGRTRVHCISGGGSEGLFSFDWGAADSFSSIVWECLKDYSVE